MNRLTDNDHQLGPITYAKSNWKRISFILSSGDEYDGVPPRNKITIYAFGWIVRISLWSMIQPFAQKVIAGWDAATVERMGRNYYYNYFEREYGFSLSDGNFFQLHYGVQSGFGNLPDGMREKSWCKHLPWTQWRMVRHSYHNLDGSIFSIQKPREWGKPENIPTVKFHFRDYDGEEITSSCYIEEREWHLGEGWFKWLSWFAKPSIRRSLDLVFDKEVGPEKGSWKGGTIGHDIDMQPNETPEEAFKRYCQKEHRSKYRTYQIEFVA